VRRYTSLRGRREFALVLRRGRVSRGKHLVVFTLAAPRQRIRPERAHARRRVVQSGQALLARVGLVITKKVGSAVERNLLRRRCKAILDATLADDARWYVVQLRPSAIELSYAQLREALAMAIGSRNAAAGKGSTGPERPGR
jgi:ribonuclease P protein component